MSEQRGRLTHVKTAPGAPSVEVGQKTLLRDPNIHTAVLESLVKDPWNVAWPWTELMWSFIGSGRQDVSRRLNERKESDPIYYTVDFSQPTSLTIHFFL